MLHRLPLLQLLDLGSSLLWLLLLHRFAELDSTPTLLRVVIQPLHRALAHDIKIPVPEAVLYLLEAFALLREEDKPLGQHLVALLAQADLLGEPLGVVPHLGELVPRLNCREEEPDERWKLAVRREESLFGDDWKFVPEISHELLLLRHEHQMADLQFSRLLLALRNSIGTKWAELQVLV